MKIHRRDVSTVTVLDLHGKLTGQESYALFHEMLERLLDEGRFSVVLNLEAVPWVESSGVAALIGGYFTFVRRGGRIRFTGLNPRVDEVFFTIDLRNILDVYDSESDAVASFVRQARGGGG